MNRLRLFLLFAALVTPPFVQSGEKAVFAGGCFWCTEQAFQEVEGVTAVVSGYTGGTLPNPDYKQVSRGGTGHYEAVEVEYDPNQISYDNLLDVFWRNIDPFDAAGQFCDKGSSYLSAIFVGDEHQRQAALRSIDRLPLSKQQRSDIATKILDAGTFYPAEEYHQDYYLKNPVRYKYYKWRCGRSQRLEVIWGKPGK